MGIINVETPDGIKRVEIVGDKPTTEEQADTREDKNKARHNRRTNRTIPQRQKTNNKHQATQQHTT